MTFEGFWFKIWWAGLVKENIRDDTINSERGFQYFSIFIWNLKYTTIEVIAIAAAANHMKVVLKPHLAQNIYVRQVDALHTQFQYAYKYHLQFLEYRWRLWFGRIFINILIVNKNGFCFIMATNRIAKFTK